MFEKSLQPCSSQGGQTRPPDHRSGAILSLFLGRDVKKRVFRAAMDMKSLRSARKSVASVTRLSSNKANLVEIDLTIPVTVADIYASAGGESTDINSKSKA
jgi:hypothetical protein